MTAAAFIIVSALLVGQTKEVDYLFEHPNYEFGKPPKKDSWQYYFFAPRSLNPAERYPLLVWLHWREVVHSGNQMECLINDPKHLEKHRYFILAIPCPPPDNPRFSQALGVADGDRRKTDSAFILDLVRKTMEKYPVDPDRVYLAGICRGSGRCLNVATEEPSMFAAAVLMAHSGGNTSQVANLGNLPIWAFHSKDEAYVPADRSREMEAVVRGAGGNIFLTLVPSADHDCWTSAFQEHDVMTWLLAQRRGSLCWTPPGCAPWRLWHVLLLPIGFLAIVWSAWKLKTRAREGP